jgi:uncharacterized protein
MESSMSLRIQSGITEVGRNDWNSLASGSRTPFYEWEWLALLEQSGSIEAANGWQPLHLTISQAEKLKGILPLYLKAHSDGEFVFDYGWADLARQLNISYYPKLVGTVPATPSGFYRLFCEDPSDMESFVSAGISALTDLGMDNNIAGISFLFCDPDFGCRLEGFQPWVNQSYLWVNRGYESFDDFLAELSKNYRRNIRREWDSLSDQGIRIIPLTGDELTEGVMDKMYRFYLQTNARFGPWAARFLNREFFLLLPEYVAHRVVLFAAVPSDAGPEDALGISFCVYKGDWLFGRYWGGDPGIKNLHFNTCYYAPMRWMIERRMRYFDPGAGSPHKLHRGFMPHPVVSYHRFFDLLFSEIFEENIKTINRENHAVIRRMEDSVPFTGEAKTELRNELHRLFAIPHEIFSSGQGDPPPLFPDIS